MEIKKFLTVAIVASVVALIFGAILPVFADTSASEDTFTNEGYFRMSRYDDTTDHTFTWTYEKPNAVVVDGKEIIINYGLKNGQITIIANSVWLVRMYHNENGEVSSIAFLYGASGTKSAIVANQDTASVTLTSGTATVTFGAYTGTHSYDIVYLPDNEGAYTMCMPDKPTYLNEDSSVYGFGLTRIRDYDGLVGSPGIGFAFSGDIENGVTGSVWRGGDQTTVTNSAIVATEKNGYKDLYTFDKITAVATYTETVEDETVSTTTDLVYNIVIVPYEVTSERSVHMSGSLATLFNLLPLLIGFGLVIGVAGIVISKRM